MADDPLNPIPLDREIEGDHAVNEDVFFCRLGDPVPLLPSDSDFDLQAPPCRPLAISERFRAMFIAYTEGFFVVMTKEVIEAGKEIKEKGKGPSVRDLCVLDVKIGRVSVLALSNDSSVLAAAVGGEISFFHVPSLLDKDFNPSFSYSLKNTAAVKEFRWQKNAQKTFLIVSNDGLLYRGRIKDQVQDIMDNVDSVDWSLSGDNFAVATKNKIRIFSSDLKEHLHLSLLFQLWSTDAEADDCIKVDTIEWVRDDSLVVSCIRLKQDGSEEGCMVQVITSGAHKFTESAVEPVVFSFPDVFEDILDDILPSGAGPYLLLSYLDRWELLLVSNKKAIDQHICLLKYLDGDDKKELVFQDFNNDKYKPTIGLKENGDDNVILGFGIDKTAVYERVIIQIGPESKELSPQGVLFCLTCEGKLLMYHLAKLSDPLDLPQYSLPHVDLRMANELSAATPSVRDDNDDFAASKKEKLPEVLQVSKAKADEDSDNSALKLSKAESEKTSQILVGTSHLQPSASSKVTGSGPQNLNLNISSVSRPITNNILDKMSSEGDFTQQANNESYLRSTNLENINKGTTSSEPSSFISQNYSVSSSGSGTVTKAFLDKNASRGVSSGQASSQQSSLGLQSTGTLFGSDVFASKSSLFSSGVVHGAGGKENSEVGFGNNKNNYQSASASIFTTFGSNISDKESASPSQSVATGKLLISKPQPSPDYNKTSKSFQALNTESESRTQPYTVIDMIKELDSLLLLIEQQGGFKDSCIAFQKNSLLSVEEGLKNLSEMTGRCRSHIEGQFSEIEELQRKKLQVSAKQVYMEGILKQASNKQYWDIWNQQKLSPEFEQKRQAILKANQDLTNQLIQLERHFNTLEINRYSESSRISVGRGAAFGNFGQSKYNRRAVDHKQQIQSMHTVYKTLNSQLAAAEKLSDCLTKQLSTLSISPSPKKRAGVTRELFESIGLVHVDNTSQSPISKSPGFTPRSTQLVSPFTVTDNRIAASNVKKYSEPDTTRRQRDSLDGAWGSFEPKKTTVRRMANKGLVKGDFSSPFRRAKAAFDSQLDSLTRVQQETSTPIVSKESSTGKFQNLTSNVNMVKPSKQISESSPASLFKWAHVGPGPTALESHHLDNLQKSPKQTQKNVASVQPLFNPVQSNVKDKDGSVLVESSAVVSNSTMSSVSPPKTRFSIQKEVPKSSPSFNLFSGASILTTQPALQSKAQEIKQSNLEIVKDDPNNARQDNTKSAAVSPTIVPQSSNDSNFAPFSLRPSGLSSSESVKAATTTTKEQSKEPISAFSFDSKASNLSPFSAFSFSSVNSTSAPSTTNMTSVTSPSSSTKVAGFSPSSLAAKTSTEPKFSTTLLPSTSTASDSLLNEVKSRSESSSQQAQEDKVSLASEFNAAATSKEPSNEKSATLASVQAPILPTSSAASLAVASDSHSKVNPANATAFTVGRNEGLDINFSSQEDEMEEETPDSGNMLNLGALGGFGLGSTPPSSNPISNPFGGAFGSPNTSTVSSPALTAAPGQLFRPPSFSLPSAQPTQPSLSVSSNTFSGGNSGGFAGFGQPAQVAPGQQALGSVLGAFGQSRQLGLSGFGAPTVPNSGGFTNSGGFAGAATGGGGFTSFASKASGFSGVASGGGFAGATAGGGFANAPMGGGFTSVTPSGGAFGAASSQGTAFGAVAPQGGGFASATPQIGGFAAAASQGGGFGGAGLGGGFGGGGFGGFSGSTGGAFSQFGANSGTGAGKPPAELLTQMRK